MRLPSYRNITFLLAIAALFTISACFAAENEVRVDLQVNLFMKILRYDRNIASRGEEGLKLGILYNPEDKNSLKFKDGFVEEFNLLDEKSVNDIPMLLIPIRGTEEISKAIASYHIGLLYIGHGFDNQLNSILMKCHESSILTLTGVPEYAERGVAVGLGVKDGKPEIIINHTVAKEVGADFSADILKLARVLK